MKRAHEGTLGLGNRPNFKSILKSQLDVLECARCKGRMRVIAALSEPAVVSKVLSHLDLPTTA